MQWSANSLLRWLLLISTVMLLPMALPTVQELSSPGDPSQQNGRRCSQTKGEHGSRSQASPSSRRRKLSKGDGDDGRAKQAASLGKVLKQLARERARPTAEQWELFRRLCKSSKRQLECRSIFAYFRRVLLPLTFPGRAHHEQRWAELGVIGLAKREDVSQTKASTTLEATRQYGDDSSVLGGDYLIVSDGVTRNPVSNFFSRQVVEFLSAGMQLLERQQRGVDPADQLLELIASLEDLIMDVQLPAAATLSLAYLFGNRRYLYVGTLGDSEVKVIRKGKVIYSSPLQRTQNIPGQLNARRPAVMEHLTLDRVRVRKDDWVVVASDGLWDNVLAEEVAALLKGNVKNSLTRTMNKALGRKEGKGSVCRYHGRLKRERCVGGRKDDITIVMARV